MTDSGDLAGHLLTDDPVLPGQRFHDLMDTLRASTRLPTATFFGASFPLLTRYDDLEAAFRDDEGLPAGPTYASSIEPCQGRTFESVDGAEHHQLRRLSTRGLRRRPVERYADERVRTIARDVIHRFRSGGEVDLVAAFTSVFPFLVFADRVGLPTGHEGDLMRWSFEILGYSSNPEQGLRAAAELTAIIDPVIAARRATPTDDLISSMVTTVDQGRRLDDEEVRSHVRALFAAGASTTYHGLGNTLYALLTHPDALHDLRTTPSLGSAAVDEMLRWEPPLGVLPRLAPNTAEVAGSTIEAGSLLLFGIAAANRDPAVHQDPHRFDITRRPTKVLTFGLGSHHCPGAHLAKAQIAVGVQELLAACPRIRLLDPEASAPSGTVMRGPRELRVAWG